MKNIQSIAAALGIREGELDLYGKYKAKLSADLWERTKKRQDGKLILVTAMNPTPAGEGKTLTTIGLSQAINKLGHSAIAALREPSLGPCMGIKGGATGSGRSQVIPMEDINLHFTGDMHAITAAHNLLSSMIDNHIHHGNELGINPKKIVWKRAVDMNDRSLRQIVIGLGDTGGMTREDGFMITVASEIMAILCLCESITNLKKKIGEMIVAYTFDGKPVTVSQLKAERAMTVLLKDAIHPNLVQTIEETPAIIHGGPFGNIAHGCSSIIGTRLALKLADYVCTEAGFGADLGAEKFFNIKCRKSGLTPQAAVIVATIKALKYNAGVPKQELHLENQEAVRHGFENLKRHIGNISQFGIPLVVALNHFYTDTEEEVEAFLQLCREFRVEAAVSKVWELGGEGGAELARKIIELTEGQSGKLSFTYEDGDSIPSKIEQIVRKIYRGKTVTYSQSAEKSIRQIEELGLSHLPVCIAKTQYSFSDNPKLLGAPVDFEMHVREIKLSAGAGFIVVMMGQIMTMPALPKRPSAEQLDIDGKGTIHGLF
ncbi:formate--tetrahydrofolate ligase [Paenibacillus larvae]|uniref:Formate--tetrahydrofolate ligase n=1 Tax=Paenibacillus larvae subsp. larvae TaxID=147375 RepID=A0A6C0QTJ7_9BACL|nr:formate--tetrahydrofolate ligase [Paenibacillus larvae]QHZ52085.1 Formate--tetrahydrofolate ligase [Paenibacillus larvae subsp. larvae]